MEEGELSSEQKLSRIFFMIIVIVLLLLTNILPKNTLKDLSCYNKRILARMYRNY
jgi:hypothetical protein